MRQGQYSEDVHSDMPHPLSVAYEGYQDQYEDVMLGRMCMAPTDILAHGKDAAEEAAVAGHVSRSLNSGRVRKRAHSNALGGGSSAGLWVFVSKFESAIQYQFDPAHPDGEIHGTWRPMKHALEDDHILTKDKAQSLPLRLILANTLDATKEALPNDWNIFFVDPSNSTNAGARTASEYELRCAQGRGFAMSVERNAETAEWEFVFNGTPVTHVFASIKYYFHIPDLVHAKLFMFHNTALVGSN